MATIEQGYDPRDFSLVAFGGAGPLHANALGELLGAYPVIIPASPGVLCAYGDATTLLRHEIGRSFIRNLRQADRVEVLHGFDELLTEVRKVMHEDQGVVEEKQVCSNYSLLLLQSQFLGIPSGYNHSYSPLTDTHRNIAFKPTFATMDKQIML